MPLETAGHGCPTLRGLQEMGRLTGGGELIGSWTRAGETAGIFGSCCLRIGFEIRLFVAPPFVAWRGCLEEWYRWGSLVG
jgi:hypothetical protein